MLDHLLEQIHDIEEIDPIHWWPLAIGWQIVILLTILLCVGICYFIARRMAFRRSWKSDFLAQLQKLEAEFKEENRSETVVGLSQLLRRMTLQLFSRKECASLTGDRWLQWLTEHDPKQFNWKEKGKVLALVPYAPINQKNFIISDSDMREIMHAIKQWIL